MAEKPQQKYKKDNYSKSPGNKAAKEPRRFYSDSHSHKKRPSSKPFGRTNDIYITNKSNFKVKKHCKVLWNSKIFDHEIIAWSY